MHTKFEVQLYSFQRYRNYKSRSHCIATHLVTYFCIFTTRAYARAVLGVVILSVRLSHACIVTELNDALQIFLYHAKGQSLCYSDTKSGWSSSFFLPSEICVQSDPPPSKNADIDRFPLITSKPQEIAKKFNYDEYKVDHGLSNEPQMECVRYPYVP